MREDIHRWQEKYRRAGPIQPLAPDTLLLRHTDLFVAGGIAFDIASGTGHSAVYLAQRGYQVVAFDCSSEGLRRAQQLAAQENTTIQAVALDLDRAQLPFNKANVLTCFRYLNRALFPAMEAAIRPGGLFIYKTFNVHHLKTSPRFNPKYVLQPGELASLMPNANVIELSDGTTPDEIYSWLVARIA